MVQKVRDKSPLDFTETKESFNRPDTRGFQDGSFIGVPISRSSLDRNRDSCSPPRTASIYPNYPRVRMKKALVEERKSKVMDQYKK